MLDIAGIVFSGVMILFIAFRALQLDSSRPWFEALPPEEAPASEATPAQPKRRASIWPARVRPVRSRDASR